MATKNISPGTTGNLQTDLGGAPSGGDIFHLNEGAVHYTTVPDWSGTAVASVFLGPGFAGSIDSAWILQISAVLDNAFGGEFVNISCAGTTIAEVRHQPAAGGKMILSGSGGTVTALHNWGPLQFSAQDLTDAYFHAGQALIQAGDAISGVFSIDAGAIVTLQRDYAAGADVSGTLIFNPAATTTITPDGTTTVRSGGVLKIVKSGTWTTTTAVLVLKAGAVLDLSELVAPFVLEDLTDEAGSVIIQRKGWTPFTIAGARVQPGGGATVRYVGE